jgi:glycosyltransferase involved in cell wall biosynthesis
MFKLDRHNSYFVFINGHFEREFSFQSDNVTVVRCRLLFNNKLFRIAWEQMVFPFLLKRYKIDLVHSFSHTGLIFPPCRALMVIYDMQHYRYPKNFSLPLRLYLKLMMQITASQSDRIMTISDHSRNDIVKFLGLPAEKIDVVYGSSRFSDKTATIAPAGDNESEKSRVRMKYSLDGRYILSVASTLPHKNLDGLIRAYALMAENTTGHLVLVGLHLKSLNAIRKTIKAVGLSEQKIKLLGYVPDEDLPTLYAMADFFVFPSFFEGFGLPLLEAMALGCPLIASMSGSIPEVAGDAALYIDPYNIQDIADKMTGLIHNENLRKLLIQKGQERLKFFSWDKSAGKVLKIYENIAG